MQEVQILKVIPYLSRASGNAFGGNRGKNRADRVKFFFTSDFAGIKEWAVFGVGRLRSPNTATMQRGSGTLDGLARNPFRNL
jgi:hypothetical protein